jgi:hypothetical protein
MLTSEIGSSIALPRLIARPKRTTSGNAGLAGTSGSYRRATEISATWRRNEQEPAPPARSLPAATICLKLRTRSASVMVMRLSLPSRS